MPIDERTQPTEQVLDDSGDTVAMDFRLGSRVLCVMGDFKGLEGTVVAPRTDARVLVRLTKGVVIEVPRICLRNVDGDR